MAMLDPAQRLFVHTCVEGHVWSVFGDMRTHPVYADDRLFTYDSPFSAICPICRDALKKMSTGLLKVQVPHNTRGMWTFHTCFHCRKAMFIPMMQIRTGVQVMTQDALLGFSYWQVPQPFPLYCNECGNGNETTAPRAFHRNSRIEKNF